MLLVVVVVVPGHLARQSISSYSRDTAPEGVKVEMQSEVQAGIPRGEK